MKKRLKVKNSTRSILQKEINSACPFCKNTDVEYFHVHHIDENPANSQLSNLLLLCPNCHSKITKGDIPREQVELVKKTGALKHEIECAAIDVDNINCAWENYDNIENAFIKNDSNKSEFPILNFAFINHSKKTILLKKINLKVKHLYSGLSGIPRPKLLKSITSFKIKIPKENEESTLRLTEEIVIPAGQAVKFQIQLFQQWNDTLFPIDGRKILYFSLNFNNDVLLELPKIFLNCKSENEKIKISLLT